MNTSFNPKLRDFGRPVGFDVFHADIKDILRMPLVNQPGETWEYGINIDWAGIVLERATGQGLNDWMQEKIMQPLGIKNVNMLPTEEMKKNLAYMHQRWPGGAEAEERDHMYREPIIANTDDAKKRIFHSMAISSCHVAIDADADVMNRWWCRRICKANRIHPSSRRSVERRQESNHRRADPQGRDRQGNVREPGMVLKSLASHDLSWQATACV